MSGNSHLDSFIDLPHVNSQLCTYPPLWRKIMQDAPWRLLLIQMRVPWPCSNPGRVACRHCNAVQHLSHAGLWGKRIAIERSTVAVCKLRFLPRRSGWKLLGKKLCTSEPSCGQQKSTSMRAETQTHQVWGQQFQKYMIFCCQWACSARMKLSAPVCPFIRRSYQICTQTFPSGIKPMATKGVGRVCTANRL